MLLAKKLLSSSLILFLIILLAGCTNWKAKYITANHNLDECLNAKDQEVITIETIRADIETPVQSDTIFIPAILKPGKIKTIRGKIDYKKSYQFTAKLDSVNVWLTIHNKLYKRLLIQTVTIDSVKYPLKTKKITRTVKEIIRDINIWKSIAVGAIAGMFVIIMVLIFSRVLR